jgi:hypothetical protein
VFSILELFNATLSLNNDLFKLNSLVGICTLALLNGPGIQLNTSAARFGVFTGADA